MGLHSQYPQFNEYNILPKEQRRYSGGGKVIIHCLLSVGAELAAEPESVTAQVLHEAQALYLHWLQLFHSLCSQALQTYSLLLIQVMVLNCPSYLEKEPLF